MAIDSKIDLFIQSTRKIKRKVFNTHLISSVSAVIAVVLFIIFVFYYAYKDIIENDYENILYGIYHFQNRLINEDNYQKDLKYISSFLTERKGVVAVWISDRNGKCIYHTDKEFLKSHYGKVFPPDYYENIKNMWIFEKDLPVIKCVKIKKGIYERLSIPLYPFGKDSYDFILGIDVKRFPLLPNNVYLIAAIIIGYLAIFSSLIFFSVWMIVSKKINDITTQVMILAGSLKEGTGGKKSEEIKSQEGVGESKEKGEEKVYEPGGYEGSYVEPVGDRTEYTTNEEQKEGGTGEEKIEGKVIKGEKENTQIQFIDYKQRIFRKVAKNYDNIVVELYPFNSKSVDGTYIGMIEGESYDWFFMFSMWEKEIKRAKGSLEWILKEMKEISSNKSNVKDFAKSINEICVKNKIEINFSVMKVGEKIPEYISLGKNYALYNKNGENEVKILDLGLPRAGTIADNAEDIIEYAEINFNSNDIFIMIPDEFRETEIDGESLDSVVRKEIIKRANNREVIGKSLEKIINNYRRKNREMGETGFVFLRFI